MRLNGWLKRHYYENGGRAARGTNTIVNVILTGLILSISELAGDKTM